MKVRVHLSNGTSPIFDLGEVPDIIKSDQQEMFHHMLNILVEKGIDPYEILVVETVSSTVLN